MRGDVFPVTGVVEQMLDHAAHGRCEALEGILDERFTIIEPDSPVDASGAARSFWPTRRRCSRRCDESTVSIRSLGL